ncbi:uncharacterized protein LOC115689301 [Syzygium oleosum]|uniref:uncharacterized protein LOC115689301 n=1 Tax=Syzygium oleosum TaxID=219896 RepID=UPI0024BB65DB|nr:uncharacterized protein LOC115689301 [Syzygium oleosum]
MAQVLKLALPRPNSASARPDAPPTRPRDLRRWASLRRSLRCNGRFSCLFSDNRREEQARKALESALGGKKSEFEKWDKEIKRREEVGGGGDAGGGGWFGWGRRFGWSNGDNFWQEAKQTSLAVLGIILMFLFIAKGEVMLAMVLNPLLFALRGTRNALTFVTTKILRLSPSGPADFDALPKKENSRRVSAKEEVLRKWGSA